MIAVLYGWLIEATLDGYRFLKRIPVMPQLKLLEDFIALARTGSFVRAAELRHVTHPAFGRRIRALESWAGAALVDRSQQPLALTPQGQVLLKTAHQVVQQLELMRRQIEADAGPQGDVLRIASGRTLARTLVTNWLAGLRKGRKPALASDARVDITTGMMADMAVLLAEGKADFLCCYEHPALSTELSAANYHYMTLATDKLVPVCQPTSKGLPRFPLAASGAPVPLIGYSGGLAMSHILGDKLQAMPYPLVPTVYCDSLDAALGAAINGLGVAWLPWSLVVSECRHKTLQALGGRSEEIAFEVRLYRSRSPLSRLAEAVWQMTQQRA